jgi:hypothetical protein
MKIFEELEETFCNMHCKCSHGGCWALSKKTCANLKFIDEVRQKLRAEIETIKEFKPAFDFGNLDAEAFKDGYTQACDEILELI